MTVWLGLGLDLPMPLPFTPRPLLPFTAGDDITELQVLLEPQVAGAPTNMNSEVKAVVEPKKLLLGRRMRSCMLNQDRPE